MIYTAQCRQCGIEQDYYATVANRKKTPVHCGRKMQRIMVAPMLAPMFEAYRAVGIPGQPWIKTRAEHCATLKRHNKVEIGNDTSLSAPKMEPGEFEHQQAAQMQELISDREEILKIAKDVGLKPEDVAI